MHYGKNVGGIHVPVRGCKAGRHKRSSSKATAGISGKYISGIHCQKITGKSGDHYRNWRENCLPPPRRILAYPAKAMVDMIVLCFPGFGYLP